jgi:hypothetical protein
VGFAVWLWPARAVCAEAEAPTVEVGAEGTRDRDALGPWVPDYARLQTGGFVGLVAVGIGYAAFEDILNVALHYGYTPFDTGDVHALELSVSARPFELRAGQARLVPIYIGLGVLGTWGARYYLDLPDRYPESRYYPPNAIQPVGLLGIEADWIPERSVIERHGLFFEVKTLAGYTLRYARNPDVVDFEDIVSAAVGYRIAF